MDSQKAHDFIEKTWDESILPVLEDYIRIPSLSPAFDPDWEAHGFMDRVVDLAGKWIRSREIPGLKMEVLREPGRTPVLVVDIPGDSDEVVMLYGHLDKQPPMEGWDDGLGAFEPVTRNGRLYGRGSADDGYAVFTAITAIQALKQQGIPHARCVTIIETCEESGSIDLPYYLDVLTDRLGTPSLIICLDSGCGDYERLWVTNSLRGVIGGVLKVEVLTQGVHSGDGTGIVPSSFRIFRQLLSRLEDEITGKILPAELHVQIPAERTRQLAATAEVLGSAAYDKFPFVGDMQPVSSDIEELLVNRSWLPQLEITGAEGFPPVADAGNVLRAATVAKLSLRLPPTLEPVGAIAFLKTLMEKDPPYGARITFEPDAPGAGWDSPALAPWLRDSAGQASRDFFGADACYLGEGGSIPFMGMLGERFPQAQFLITGVLGPESNAHGPNEFLEISTAKKVTSCTARVLADHFQASA